MACVTLYAVDCHAMLLLLLFQMRRRFRDLCEVRFSLTLFKEICNLTSPFVPLRLTTHRLKNILHLLKLSYVPFFGAENRRTAPFLY